MASVLFVGGWQVATVIAMAVPTAVSAVFVAASDHRELRRRGFHRLPSALFALPLPLLYLLLRGRSCGAVDPGARDGIVWSVGITVTALVLTLIGTFLQAALGGLLLVASQSG